MEIVDGEFAWDPAAEEATLKNINFQVKKSQLVMVVGPVGSGKSSLGLSLLGEINKRKGNITLQGTVAYAGQQVRKLFSTSHSLGMFYERKKSRI
jgi:ABC-type protease/lipase transport system fused ATPase/permease subunit